MNKTLVLITLLSLTACGGGGGSSNSKPTTAEPSVTTSSSIASSKASSSSVISSSAATSSVAATNLNTNIVGLWDVSEDYGVDGKDEVYVLIENKGTLTIYDYAGDTFDAEGNCYWIDKFPNLISSLGGNRYLISPVGAKPFVEIYTVSGNTLTGVDEVITTDSVTTTAVKTKRAISDFTPTCASSLNQRPVLNAPLVQKNQLYKNKNSSF